MDDADCKICGGSGERPVLRNDGVYDYVPCDHPSPADDPVEAVARAIYEADDPWAQVWPWPNPQGGGADKYRDIARTILPILSTLTPARAEGFKAGSNHRTGPISEHLHNISDTSPQAAAARILAFLDWKGAGVGDVGPAMYYGDLRILAEAVAATSGLR